MSSEASNGADESGPTDGSQPAIDAASLRPYVSVVVLVRDHGEMSAALAQLKSRLTTMAVRARGGTTVTVTGSGLSEPPTTPDRRNVDQEFSADAFAYRRVSPPAWAAVDSRWQDTTHHLCIWCWHKDWVAVSCDGALETKLQRWLDSSPRPMLRRVPAGTINATLLTGEARGLWLRSTQGRRRTKADAKNLSGQSLSEALNPLDDSSYALGSARAEIIPDPEFAALSGIVGVTPRRSKIWFGRTTTLNDFYDSCSDLLSALATSHHRGDSTDQPFPYLAAEVHDLSVVHGAYEITWVDADDLPTAEVGADLVDAAEVLSRTTLTVNGCTTDASFVAEVALDGRLGGAISCTPDRTHDRLNLDFRIHGAPTDPSLVTSVRDALRHTTLLTLHYESGHSVTQDAIYSTSIDEHEFRSWDWHDFTGFDVGREKPLAKTPQATHDGIGADGDNSLFSWVLRTYGDRGFLTCDDGANEVADFVLLADDGHLSLIHVKAAGSRSTTRKMSASRFEVVVSQATKNARYLDQERLATALATSPVPTPAAWLYGDRQADRRELLEHLAARSPSALTTVIVVQPHVTQSARTTALTAAAPPAELRRLRLLETMLHSARGSIVSQGSELLVVGSI
ncbi:hypothetical protein [Pimelobacter simplex]|uniref:hypothetical protein n=1 Tax=Nocardioides simplex TaxID=2045 RepID=UPI00214FDB8F|nr:hypothetical protein [Pimelobacter simplex]UUW90307.1 hypothetical protein M0M43_02135 [Pimelobacter simplex]UUW94137.1 hypothetical protein M0M48_20650 [Pimelobacter simplex]